MAAVKTSSTNGRSNETCTTKNKELSYGSADPPQDSPSKDHDVNNPTNDDRSRSSLSRTQLVIGTLMVLSRFFGTVGYGLMAPFYPQEAVQKGVNQTIIGIIFTMYEAGMLVGLMCTRPLLSRMSGKYLCVTGTITVGYCSLLFGFMNHAPPGPSYVGLCIVIRLLIGAGYGIDVPVVNAIMASTFPDNVALATGLLPMANATGLLISPLIGGLLYKLGGFMLPFITFGSLQMFIAAVMSVVLPSDCGVNDSPKGTQKISFAVLFKTPDIYVACLLIFHSFMVLGFNNATLALHVSQFGLNPLEIALVFLAVTLLFAASCPITGKIADKKPILINTWANGGYVVMVIAFLCSGPTPLLPLPNALWLVISGQIICNFCLSRIVLAYPMMLRALVDKGFPASMEVHVTIGTLRTFSNAIGGTVGPLIGGIMTDRLGYPMAATIMAFTAIEMLLLSLVCHIITKTTKKSEPRAHEKQHLLS